MKWWRVLGLHGFHECRNKDFKKAGAALQIILAAKELAEWTNIDWVNLITGPESLRGNLLQSDWDNFKPWIYEAVFEASATETLAFLFQNIPTETRTLIYQGILNVVSQKARQAGLETEKWLENNKPSIYRYLKSNLGQNLDIKL